VTIYPARPASFTCVICGTLRDYGDTPGQFNSLRWRSAEYDIPPVCRPCEITWGRSIGGWGDLNRDRRIARQIFALAAVLDCEAYRTQHGKGPLYGRT
jgi:hypothetical protein